MIHKQSVWLTLSVLLVLAWLANNRPPCPGGGRYDLQRGRCIHVRY